MHTVGKFSSVFGKALVVLMCLSVSVRLYAYEKAPSDFLSSFCIRTPSLDGIKAPGEWDGASRHDALLFMGNAGNSLAEAKPEFFIMNSAYELYIAVQVRADKPKSSLTPLSDNQLVVSFCEEDSPKNYCDKRVLTKGIYSDKHFLVIGQDADDEQKDGEGVMAWHDGAWFMELRIPLASDDTMDIQAVSGDIIRLNLLYGDGSKSGSSEPSLDSLVGIELDKLADWPSLLLATDPRTARAHSIEILGFPLDIWSAVGFFGQFLFGMRFIVQWLFSERAKRVVVPKVFWYLSICGSLVTLVYAIEQRDPVFTVSMCLNNLIYVRNLMLWKPGQSSAESI